ncbi:MAG: 5-formyltetrahydrofolate cyclo-ligase [Desulfuromonadaceae bacterium]|nr:5-formyltetrahydrofolate cyclo-ligase [Desulfuromonadaceae bacterium]MDD5104460.1 5-formyltetrahydrofolate cyclo-ligase [Desulfuromonadaceae bacterium]
MPKRPLRSQLLAQRRALNHDSWRAASRAAQINLLLLDVFVHAQCVALYAPAHNEIDTTLLFTEARKEGKQVLFPVVCGQQLVFRPVDHIETLQKGAFGILEPCASDNKLQTVEADLVVVPGIAFDLSGHRIGYGKGFYDRFLHHPGCTRHVVGLCHDFQIVDGHIPADPHDIPMGIVITDKRVIRTH